jgi:hypothetical protein
MQPVQLVQKQTDPVDHAARYDREIADADRRILAHLDTAKPLREFLTILTLQATAGGIGFHIVRVLLETGWSDRLFVALVLSVAIWWRLVTYASITVDIYIHRSVMKICQKLNMPFWPGAHGHARQALWQAFKTTVAVIVAFGATAAVYDIITRAMPISPPAASGAPKAAPIPFPGYSAIPHPLDRQRGVL